MNRKYDVMETNQTCSSDGFIGSEWRQSELRILHMWRKKNRITFQRCKNAQVEPKWFMLLTVWNMYYLLIAGYLKKISCEKMRNSQERLRSAQMTILLSDNQAQRETINKEANIFDTKIKTYWWLLVSLIILLLWALAFPPLHTHTHT